jgi:hypothetical protein
MKFFPFPAKEWTVASRCHRAGMIQADHAEKEKTFHLPIDVIEWQ